MSSVRMKNLLEKFRPIVGLNMMAVSVVVGACTGLAAVFFIYLISFIQQQSYGFCENYLPFLGSTAYVLVPIAGALLVGPVIAYFASEAKGHGVPEVMQAIIMQGGRIRPRVAVAKIIASALCLGTGGSAGREGPIVQVGSALGSSIGQWFGFSDDRIKNLVSCGAAAGIAATFNAPLAGVAFASEVLMTELQGRMFGNVVVSAVSASVISQIFLGARPSFVVPSYVMRSPWEIVLYMALGLVSACVGVMCIRMLSSFETVFDSLKKCPLALRPALGALLLGMIGVLYLLLPGVSYHTGEQFRRTMPLIENMPHVFGSGFTFIEQVLQGKTPFLLMFVLIFLKPLATSFTLGSGNSGGVFAPSLFTGAMCGGAFGYAVNLYFPEISGDVGAYALVGMAAVFSAAARAPLTAMLIVFEMSNDYYLILPLMVAGVVATFVAELLQKESIYTIKLAKRGIHFSQGRDMDVMQEVLVQDVMNDEPFTFDVELPFSDLYAVFQETHFLGFPVTEGKGRLYGIVTLQDMTRVLSHTDTIAYLKVKDVATINTVTVYPDEPVWAAIQKMSPRDLARLPVVSREDEGKLIGLISRSDILRAYDVGIMRKQQAQYASERMALRRVSDIEFLEIRVIAGAHVTGKQLSDIGLPPEANVVSVERQGVVLIPHGSTAVLVDDMFTILCRADSSKRVREIFYKKQ